MPFVNIKLLGGEDAPTAEQKAELIQGVTDLLVKVLNKILQQQWSLLMK